MSLTSIHRTVGSVQISIALTSEAQQAAFDDHALLAFLCYHYHITGGGPLTAV